MFSWSVEPSVTSRSILQLEVFFLFGSLKSQGTITSKENLNPVLKGSNSTSSDITEWDQGVHYKIWSPNIYWCRNRRLVLAIPTNPAPVSTVLWVVNATICKESAFCFFLLLDNCIVTRTAPILIVPSRWERAIAGWEKDDVKCLVKQGDFWFWTFCHILT